MLEKCVKAGLRMTNQRVSIATTLDESLDHPDADEIYRRAHEVDPTISIATVYRTLGIFEKAGLIQKVTVGDGRSELRTAGSINSKCTPEAPKWDLQSQEAPIRGQDSFPVL